MKHFLLKQGGWEVDAKTYKVSWTEEAYRIHEVPLSSKLPLEKAIDFFHPDDRPKLETAIQKAFDHGQPYDMELRFITAKGKDLWTHTTCKPIIVDGKTVKLTGAFQDITDRKRVEIDLEKSKARISTLMSNLPSMAYQCKMDEQWTMLFVNDACKQLTGYLPAQLIHNKDISYYELIHPDDRVFVRQHVEKALNAGKHFELEYRIISADGKEKWVWERGVQGASQDHGTKLLEGIIHDITDRKHTEEELQKYQSKLEKLVKKRTYELEEKNKDLERFNKLFIGREFRIKELKDKVKEWEKAVGSRQ